MKLKYSSVFWMCYGFAMIWSAMVIGSFSAFHFDNPNFETINTTEAALSYKLTYRRVVIASTFLLIVNYMLFTRNRYLSAVVMFSTAWLWAAYIDDTLVMADHIFVPDHWIPNLAIMLRPILLLATSWMAFETHLRAEN